MHATQTNLMCGLTPRWVAPLGPFVQTARENVYVEYALLAHGPECPAETVEGVAAFQVLPGFVAYVSVDLRTQVLWL